MPDENSAPPSERGICTMKQETINQGTIKPELYFKEDIKAVFEQKPDIKPALCTSCGRGELCKEEEKAEYKLCENVLCSGGQEQQLIDGDHTNTVRSDRSEATSASVDSPVVALAEYYVPFEFHSNYQRELTQLTNEEYSDEGLYRCSECDYTSNIKSIVTKHIQRVHIKRVHPNPHKCPQCDFRSTTKGNLKSHMMYVHSDERPFSCPQCQYSCKAMAKLSRHLKQAHSDERPFSCPQCQYSCKTKGNLTTHTKLVHSDERPFSCHQCPSSFKTMSGFTQHARRIHSNDRPFSCPQCKHTFKLKKDLKLHFTIHMDLDRRIKTPKQSCSRCSYKCESNTQLLVHVNLVHSGLQTVPFECDKCLFRCASESMLTKHMQLFNHS